MDYTPGGNIWYGLYAGWQCTDYIYYTNIQEMKFNVKNFSLRSQFEENRGDRNDRSLLVHQELALRALSAVKKYKVEYNKNCLANSNGQTGLPHDKLFISTYFVFLFTVNLTNVNYAQIFWCKHSSFGFIPFDANLFFFPSHLSFLCCCILLTFTFFSFL